jgi:DNA repair protein RecN (Recombination protein N)
VENKTRTSIYPLQEKESIRELARLLGGTSITENVLNNAKELKEQAAAFK